MEENNLYFQKDQTIHCIGNGLMAVYEKGVNLDQVFGPPYSTPSGIKMFLEQTPGLQIDTSRQTGTGIWTHQLSSGNQHLGSIVDFMATGFPCFIRKIELTQSIRFHLLPDPQWDLCINGKRYQAAEVSNGILLYGKAGISFYEQASYPVVHDMSLQIVICGPSSLDNNLNLTLLPGSSSIYFIAGADYPSCIQNTEYALSHSSKRLLENTQKDWQKFSGRRRNFDTTFSHTLPYREQILESIDSTSVLLRSQQAYEGGVIAGHNFHFAYVRDQYGASRGLLALGYLEEAKKILKYYWDIFQKHGKIQNAQSIGQSHYFHIHENDSVEITGYLILQAFDYYHASKDKEFLISLFPLLDWAWRQQISQLDNHTLSFNGDETYVAGGLMPRTALWDASAESTLLFITAGEKLLSFAQAHSLWNDDLLTYYHKEWKNTREHYLQIFYRNGAIITNRYDVRSSRPSPRFTHGVCVKCNSFGWNEIGSDGCYYCRHCHEIASSNAHPLKKEFLIPTVQLIPCYIDSSLFSPDELEKMAYGAMVALLKQPKILGHDFGVLLYALSKFHSPYAQNICKRMFEVETPQKGWSEFYLNGQASGTQYRPWESGINIESSIRYAEEFSN